MLVSEAGARQDQRRVAGIRDVNGETGRRQRARAGGKLQRRIDRRAQVEAGATGGRIAWQLRAQARVENAYGYFHCIGAFAFNANASASNSYERKRAA